MDTMKKDFDVIVVGAGIAGVATAYGLCKKYANLKIALVDATTKTNKASRTNVGLIWCQSKFLHEPHYAQWAFDSFKLFPNLVEELEAESKIKIPVHFLGGLIPTLSEEEFAQKGKYIEGLKGVLKNYPGEMISRQELEKKLPKMRFGEEVNGAAWCEEDGIVEPLLLLRAYKQALKEKGAVFFSDTEVYDVSSKEGAYLVKTSQGDLFCERVVLAAGLANKRLASFALDKPLPIFADKGQVLLTERMPYVMPIPILGCTQTFGGTTIIGFRHESRGHDTSLVPDSVAHEGAWALRVWPELKNRRVIRTWTGLRVVPDDKVAIYSHLPNNPNATVINTHSAVTFSAVHTEYLPDYIMGGALPEGADKMTLARFGFTV